MKVRATPKGRRVDPQALQAVRTLLGKSPRRRDLLIEHLHRIQDRYGHLSSAHLAALAQEMKLSQTEVFEVATFYHHFDVVKEGEQAPPALTVRVCDRLSCEMAGAQELLAASCRRRLGKDVRVIAAPCVGRCEAGAACAVVHQNPVGNATLDKVARGGAEEVVRMRASPGYIDYAAYRKAGGYRLLADCLAGKRDSRRDHEDHGGLGPARPGRRRLSGRAQVAHRRAPSRHRACMAVNIDEGEPGTFKDRCYLERDPHRFLEGMLIAAWASASSEIYIYLRDEYHGLPRDARARTRARCRSRRRARCRRSTCAAAPAPTSAAKSRR